MDHADGSGCRSLTSGDFSLTFFHPKSTQHSKSGSISLS